MRSLCIRLACSVALAGGLGQVALAQADVVTVKRPANLREAPGETSAVVLALPVQTPVTRVGARQGPWIEVRTAQGTNGWVHMFDVGAAPTAQGGNVATGALRGLTNLFGRGNSLAPTTTATATIGIRGLGAEDIHNAQPNLVAVGQVESMRADARQAQEFATGASLAGVQVDPLPVPPRAAAAAQGGQK